MLVAEQMQQRAEQQDQVGQGLDGMVEMLADHVEEPDYRQHQQNDSGSASPERLMETV